MSTPSPRIALIGGGNMGRGLIGGLLSRGHASSSIVVADVSPDCLALLARDFGVGTTQDNAAAVDGAGVVVLAVKPQQMAEVVGGLAPQLQRHRPLLVSVAAGIRAADLARWAGPGIGVVRCMPNRPALVGAGASGLYAAADVTPDQRQQAETLLAATGTCVWVNDESLIDTITALSGSGPAYFFRLAELMAQAAIAQGLPAGTAWTLAAQTLAGAGRLVDAEHAPDLARMRAEVTSKGGTTAAALAVFDARGLADVVGEAMAAAAQRSRELADEFGR